MEIVGVIDRGGETVGEGLNIADGEIVFVGKIVDSAGILLGETIIVGVKAIDGDGVTVIIG